MNKLSSGTYVYSGRHEEVGLCSGSDVVWVRVPIYRVVVVVQQSCVLTSNEGV